MLIPRVRRGHSFRSDGVSGVTPTQRVSLRRTVGKIPGMPRAPRGVQAADKESSMRKRTFVTIAAAAIGVVALVVLAGCSAAPSTPATGGTSSGGSTGTSAAPAPGTTTGGPASGGAITIANFAFAPANLEVKVGTKVTWTNNDTTQHHVVADGGSFQSSSLDTGATYSFTFAKTGTFAYHCSIHPSMVGQVTVK
jgi:plastocyanin